MTIRDQVETVSTREQAEAAAAAILADPASAPATVNGRVAAVLLGSNYWSLLTTVREGTCPVPALRIGRSIRFPTRPLLATLGVAASAA